IVSSSWSDFEAIRCSNRWTSADFFRAKPSRVSTNDIRISSCVRKRSQMRIARVEKTYSQTTFRAIPRGALRLPPSTNTGGVWNIRTPPPQVQLSILEREIHPGPHHPKIILWTANKVPAEVTDPTDVRCDANFQTAADLANSLRLRLRMTNCFENVEALAPVANKPTGSCYSRSAWPFAEPLIDRPLAAAKDRAAGT